jgi:hypothetical protein
MKKSPLAQIKGRIKKVQKFSSGGDVEGDWSDAQIEALDMDSMDDAEMDYVFDDIASGGSAVPYTEGNWTDEQIAALGMDGMSDIEMDTLLGAVGNGYVPPGLEDILSNIINVSGQPPIQTIVAGEGMQSQAPTQAVQQAQTKPEKNWFTSKNWDGSDTPKSATGALSADEVAKLTPSEKLQYMAMQRMYAPKEESSNWQKLLQLGMVGLGGLTSYKDAQDKNKALKDAYDKLAGREALAQQHFARTNLPGGYAALKPATTQFRRPT